MVEVQTEKEKSRQLRIKYRNVFGSADGTIVLVDILNELGFFSMHMTGEGDLATSNAARKILYRMGVWNDNNIVDIADALKTISVEKEI